MSEGGSLLREREEKPAKPVKPSLVEAISCYNRNKRKVTRASFKGSRNEKKGL